MKKFLLICLLFTLKISTIISQSNYNLDLSGFPVGLNGNYFDPFSSSFAAPWKISHGSPQANISSNSRSIYLAAAKDHNCGNPGQNNQGQNNPGSEGVFYPFTFSKGVKYTLSFKVKTFGTPDEILVSIANNIPDLTVLSPYCFQPNSRNYAYPTISSKQDVFKMTDTQINDFTLVELCFIPNNNYSQLWFSIKENTSFATWENGSIIASPNVEYEGIKLDCCVPTIEYNVTDKVFVAGSTRIDHQKLPLNSHARNKVLALPTNGNIIVKNTESVTFKAGDQISIKPISGAFIIQAGASFLAKIENCTCSSPGADLCTNFIPDNSQNIGGFQNIYIPNAFSPAFRNPGNSGNDEDSYFTIYSGSQYTIPYNAYKGSFNIFDRFGGLVHTQQFNATCSSKQPPSNLGFFSWNGCVNGSPAVSPAVYTYTLYLENCYTSKLFSGSVTLSGAVSSCAQNLTTSESDQTSVLLALNPSITFDSKQASITFQPNPIENLVNINLTIPSECLVIVDLYSSEGKHLSKVINGVLPKGIHQQSLNLSTISKGVYFLTFKIGNQILKTERLVKI